MTRSPPWRRLPLMSTRRLHTNACSTTASVPPSARRTSCGQNWGISPPISASTRSCFPRLPKRPRIVSTPMNYWPISLHFARRKSLISADNCNPDEIDLLKPPACLLHHGSRAAATAQHHLILADDLGYGDVGYQGQRKIHTPNIDQMAADGMRFSYCYAGTAVCAPSRASLMTGLHTGHTPIRGNRGFKPEGQFPLPDSSLTIATVLQSHGYVTGDFGKWGLGYPGSTGTPNKKGFTDFFGYNCQTLAHNYYPDHLWANTEKISLGGT